MKILFALFLIIGIISFVVGMIQEYACYKELKENNKRLKHQNALLLEEQRIYKQKFLIVKDVPVKDKKEES